MNKLQHFAKNESGVTAIEYAVIAAAIGLMLVAVMPALQAALSATYQSVADGVTEVAAQ